MRNENDTIAAVATASGEGGIAIVRVSGGRAKEILQAMFVPAHPGEMKHGFMRFGHVFDENGQALDEVMAVFFAAPNSYTRQDVAEIHTHGGLVCEKVLSRAISLGARAAERGEFTYRAFLNGRIDLSRAEAVMELIRAGSEQALRSGIRGLSGGVASRLGKAKEALLDAVALIDAAADFPEEVDEDVTFERVVSLASEVLEKLNRMSDRRYAQILEGGASVVIAGRPNAGKSSILNALLSCDRAIVTDIPGTTRDSISERTQIGGVAVTLTDTAGIRDATDTIEKMGVDRARKLMDTADCVLLVLDGAEKLTKEDEELLALRDERFITVINKSDRGNVLTIGGLSVSARTGEGIAVLTEEIYRRISRGEDDEKLSNLRHIDCAERAKQCLLRVVNAPMGTYLDLLRDDLTRAAEILGEITGENVTEKVIDSVFERFCVGK